MKEENTEKPKTQVEKWREEKILKNTEEVHSNNSDTSVIPDTSDTSDTSVISSNLYHIEHVSRQLLEESGGTLKDLILKYFLDSKNTPDTIDKISEKLDKIKGSIRTVINRYKDIFSDTSTRGVAGVIQVRDDWLEVQSNRYTEQLKEIKETRRRLEEQRNLEKNFELETLNFLNSFPPKRDGIDIFIDYDDLILHNPDYVELVNDKIDEFLRVISKHYSTPNINIINLPTNLTVNIESLRVQHLETMICVQGRVTSFGEVRPIIIEAKFECPSCGTLISMLQDYRDGDLKEPKACSCGRRGGFKILTKVESNACFLQLEDLQDRTDNPHSQRVKAIIFDRLCIDRNIKVFTPGNEIKCMGVLREVPVKKRGVKSVFLNWIFEIYSAELIDGDIELSNLDNEDIESISNLSKLIDENGLDAVIPSFAPDVWGYEEIKSAMILQLCNKRNDKKTKAIRNKSNILMIGDPGVAKSILGDFAISVSTGSRKAVGGGSSAVGITASVVKEEDSLGGYRVEPGAMILAKDVLFIDELNNLSDEDKPKLQEGMNEQTVSINKANLHVQMKVTAGIIAGANPVHGHFVDDGKSTFSEQFNIPTPILNRFDSIFVFKDNVNHDNDKKIAESMMKRHRGILKPDYNVEFLKKFFAYIKQLDDPIIYDDAQKTFQEVYSLARKTYNQGVRINPRFLEALTRMSISAAKIRQSKRVEVKDIETSLRILSQSQFNIGESLITELNIDNKKVEGEKSCRRCGSKEDLIPNTGKNRELCNQCDQEIINEDAPLEQ